jgi:hypothetical protein
LAQWHTLRPSGESSPRPSLAHRTPPCPSRNLGLGRETFILPGPNLARPSLAIDLGAAASDSSPRSLPDQNRCAAARPSRTLIILASSLSSLATRRKPQRRRPWWPLGSGGANRRRSGSGCSPFLLSHATHAADPRLSAPPSSGLDDGALATRTVEHQSAGEPTARPVFLRADEKWSSR